MKHVWLLVITPWITGYLLGYGKAEFVPITCYDDGEELDSYEVGQLLGGN